MYDKILIPTDGSEGTEAAMKHAFDHAETYGAELHVLYVLDSRALPENPAGSYAASEWTAQQEKMAEDAISMVVDAAPDSISLVEVQRSGSPATEIVNYADEADIDLIVMATHGRSGLERYLIGSISENVVRNSSRPVLTVELESTDEDVMEE